MARSQSVTHDDYVQFVPSRVDGLPGVVRATVFPDRIELQTNQGVVTHWYVDLARWPRPCLLWRFLYQLRVKPRWLPVADRDWFHEPADMFFEFYTTPRLRVYMPANEVKEHDVVSCFHRIQHVLSSGGFHTFDLG